MNMITPSDTLLRRASQFIESGRFESAAPLLAAARTRHCETPDVAFLEAQLALKANTPLRAIEILDRAILAHPNHVGLRKQRCDLRFQLGDHRGATEDAAEAVALDPTDAETKAMLGNALLELGHITQAIACLDDAVVSAPKRAIFRQYLATALSRANHTEQALRILADGIEVGPPHVALFNTAIQLCITRNDPIRAGAFAEQARQAGLADAETFAAMGNLFLAQGRRKDAAFAFQEALKFRPDDLFTKHLAATCGIARSQDRSPPAYLKQLTTSAPDPRLVATIVDIVAGFPDAARGGPIGPILDLGCGSGTLAIGLASLPHAPITGVDLSPPKLANARANGLYAHVHNVDIQLYLNTTIQLWSLMIAVTAFRHFGDLSTLMANIQAKLDASGWLICFLETMPPGTWRLRECGHYAHALDYIYECICIAGMRVLRRHDTSVSGSDGRIAHGVLLTIGKVRK